MMQKTWMRRLLFGAAGAAAGFGWYFFVGCRTGACPISSNPFVSTAYGTLIGVVAAWDRVRKPKG